MYLGKSIATSFFIAFALSHGEALGAMPEPSNSGGSSLEGDQYGSLGPETVRRYLARLAPLVARRSLSLEELTQIEVQGSEALEGILESWVSSPALRRVAHDFLSIKLSSSARRQGVDYEKPGHIAAWSVREDLPWSTILTASTCRAGDGAEADCGSGAPFNAGVLTTRAFLASRASRFNLTRASTLMGVFACRGYPMEASLEPPVALESLIQLFQTGDDGEPEGDNQVDFGNGQNCYACHGQFSVHAQLFVNFDESGMYQAAATGLQDEEGELGRSLDGLMTSHFRDPQQARSEATQFFGTPVENLGEAANVLASSEVFLPCMVQHLLVDLLGLRDDFVLPEARLEALVSAARERRTRLDPSFSDLVFGIFSDPWVVQTAAASLR